MIDQAKMNDSIIEKNQISLFSMTRRAFLFKNERQRWVNRSGIRFSRNQEKSLVKGSFLISVKTQVGSGPPAVSWIFISPKKDTGGTASCILNFYFAKKRYSRRLPRYPEFRFCKKKIQPVPPAVSRISISLKKDTGDTTSCILNFDFAKIRYKWHRRLYLEFRFCQK